MIEHCVGKSARNVTDTAILCGRNVTSILLRPYWSRRRVITVTCGAVTHDAGMIKGTILEIVANGMAGSAIGSGGGMISCLCFSKSAGRRNMIAVMARSTITSDTRMIENLGSEAIVSMANVTILSCWYMARRLNNTLIAGNKLADVTAFAATCQTWVNSA